MTLSPGRSIISKFIHYASNDGDFDAIYTATFFNKDTHSPSAILQLSFRDLSYLLIVAIEPFPVDVGWLRNDLIESCKCQYLVT